MKKWLIEKLMALRQYFVRRSSKYETSENIKQELMEFLNWYREQRDAPKGIDWTWVGLRRTVNTYLEEKDICLHGDLRKLHGANTRNATAELCMAIGAAILGLCLAIMLICYFA